MSHLIHALSPDHLEPERPSCAASRRADRASRALSLGVVIVLAPLAVPVAAFLAVLVYLDSPGPVLYRSVRVGRGGREFSMLKFRTMRDRSDGPAISAAGDPRYTPLGLILSRSRLDELPQLWNVLRADMAFVGPRPEVPTFVAHYPSDYRTILSVAPGLTGAAAVEYAWESKTLAIAEEHDRERMYKEEILPMKILIDVEYVETRSLSRDLAIIARTCLLPLRQLFVRSKTSMAGPLPWNAVIRIALVVVALVALVGGMVVDGKTAL